MLRLDRASDDKGKLKIEKKNEKKKSKPKKGFVETLKIKILANLHIFINNVHIRYEDRENKCNIGVTIEKLSFQSCNSNFEPSITKVSIFNYIETQPYNAR